MNNQDYITSFSVDKSPREVFAAINNPRAWWSQAIEGETDRLGAVFYYHYKDVHRATFKITEFEPGKKVVWHVLHNYFNFVQDQAEWTNTDIVFDIASKDGKTELTFTHRGLTPTYECYNVCSDAWGTYITKSLHDLITTGQGNPNPIDDVVEKAEQMSQGLSK